MQLNAKAREFLNQYHAGLCSSYDQQDAGRWFALTDPKETQLRDALLESADFLKMLTVADVDQLQGQVVPVGGSGLYTGRVADGRFRKKVGVSGNDYKLVETDSCAALTWQLLSVWANAGDENEFFQRVQEFTNLSFALDMLRIGFNGTSVADTTDPVANPNGEDVNKGWHQIVKEWKEGQQIITDPVVLDGDGKGDYVSLDAMASDLINSKIPAQYRSDPRLVVLVGSDLVAAESFRLYQKADRPTEKIAAQLLSDSIAGRTAYVPPFMPGKRMIVTTLPNLHIYTQRGTRQRKAEFVEDRKQYENKYLRNEGYAVEYPELYAAIDESAVTIGAPVPPPEE
ncbi:phage major capsid protein, P2 family [Jejubacter calystegiae]|uniref:Phage major capsid protein, P2 family n=1 Tax=Jejubacter calystegiae TaxID=2579935 RepID=A0A4P8YJG2_9ENTR|nr:phage major capsid protein, P2 family [Jejubacter calystegiae]QCT18492.1 phage major capsid protein, P2 family [Jejubacter calystegiae]